MGTYFSSSYNASEIVNTAMNTVVVANTASCSSSASTSQIIDISHIKSNGCAINVSGISQESIVIPTTKCLQENTTNIDIKNTFENEIKQTVDKQTSAPFFSISASSSAQVAAAITDIGNTVSITDVLTCANNSISSQVMTYGYYDLGTCPANATTLNFSNLSQRIVNKQTLECLQKNTQGVVAIAKLQTALDQVSKEQSALNTTLVLVIVIIVIILLVLIGLRVRSKASKRR